MATERDACTNRSSNLASWILYECHDPVAQSRLMHAIDDIYLPVVSSDDRSSSFSALITFQAKAFKLPPVGGVDDQVMTPYTGYRIFRGRLE